MLTVLLVVHLIITLALIGVVLIQRSEGGGLGIGSSQGMGSFMTGRGTANLLTRSTSVLAGAFMLLSLVLALYSRGTNGVGHSIIDTPGPTSSTQTSTPAPAAPASAPLASTPTAPQKSEQLPAKPVKQAPSRPAVPTN